ncbi:hypothetical protein EWB00_002028, partial [Schistosoma japonicum]
MLRSLASEEFPATSVPPMLHYCVACMEVKHNLINLLVGPKNSQSPGTGDWDIVGFDASRSRAVTERTRVKGTWQQSREAKFPATFCSLSLVLWPCLSPRPLETVSHHTHEKKHCSER